MAVKQSAFAAFGDKADKYVDRLMIAMSASYLVVYSLQVIPRGTDFGTQWAPTLDVLYWVIYTIVSAAFFWNLAVELAQPKELRNWSHWAAENFLGVLTLFSVNPSLHLLKLAMVFRGVTQLVQSLASRLGALVMFALPLVAYVMALSVLDAETAPDAVAAAGGNITNMGEALWWAAVTMSTVGYGDFFPHTMDGRLIGVLTLAGGIGLIATVTAMIATNIINSAQALREAAEKGIVIDPNKRVAKPVADKKKK